MFGDYSLAELGSILVMQGFSGLILFSVFLLMALGLAIIFGQMGVINMAHGEFMILGAYMTYLCSHLFEAHFPSMYSGYFFVAMAVAFIASGALGLLVEWLLIRHLYARPLDTLLVTVSPPQAALATPSTSIINSTPTNPPTNNACPETFPRLLLLRKGELSSRPIATHTDKQ